MADGVSRYPGETAREWAARATSRYAAAVAAVAVQSRRLGLDRWSPAATPCTADAIEQMSRK
jgi:hypothetical protein